MFKFKFKNKKSIVNCQMSNVREAGFSIAEVIISLFVITVGLIAVLGLIVSSMRESAGSRNQIIATQLAQEGFELVRNIKDNNLLTDGEEYNTGLGDSSNVCADYLTATAGSSFSLVCPASGNRLYYNSSERYLHNSSSASETPFSRKLTIQNIDTSIPPDGIIDELIISSYVWWSGSPNVPPSCNSANKCVLVQNTLTEHP